MDTEPRVLTAKDQLDLLDTVTSISMDSASNSLVSAWLPHPTYHVPDRTKKSHARRRSINHIPRPRNAFILFRCDFVQQQKVPLEVENDHRNLSRISGNVWRLMTPDERAPWVRMAEEEKIKHRILYPEYTYRNRTRNGLGRYDPVGKAKKELLGVSVSKKARKVPDRRNEVKIPRVPDGLHETGAFDSFIRATENELSFPVPRRHSSCPPGAPRVLDPTPDPTLLIDPSRPQTLLVARDDLARRPSNIVMYASTAALSYCQSTSSEPPISSWAHLAPTSRILAELGTEVLDVGLPLTTGPYVVDHSQFGIHNHDHSSNFNDPLSITNYDPNRIQKEQWAMPQFINPFSQPRGHSNNSSISTTSSAGTSSFLSSFPSPASSASSPSSSAFTSSTSWMPFDPSDTTSCAQLNGWDPAFLGDLARISLADDACMYPNMDVEDFENEMRMEAIWEGYGRLANGEK